MEISLSSSVNQHITYYTCGVEPSTDHFLHSCVAPRTWAREFTEKQRREFYQYAFTCESYSV